MMEYNENLSSDLFRLCRRFLDSEKMTGDKISKSEKLLFSKIETNTNNIQTVSLEGKQANQKIEMELNKINETLQTHVEV